MLDAAILLSVEEGRLELAPKLLADKSSAEEGV
jgi:hypothetical protein